MTSKLSEDTELQVPLKNLITLIIATAVAVAAYFEVTERITNIETSMTIIGSDIEKNTDFRVRWPRGEMGALPDDVKQDSAITVLQAEVERLRERTQCR